MNRRFWCILCFFFLLYNLKVLFDDFYSVNYKIVEEADELHDEVTKIAACTHLNNIVRNNKDGNGNPIIKVEQIMAGARQASTRRFLSLAILMIEKRLNAKNLFRVDESYIFRGFVCLLLNQTAYESNESVKDFLKRYRVQLFVYSPGKQPFFYEYVFNNYHNYDSLKISKQKVYGPQYLASANCRTYRDQFSASKFNCLRKCACRWPADFYSSDTDRLFDLSNLLEEQYDPLRVEPAKIHFEKKLDNETLRRCAERCPKDDCFSETYDSITVKKGRLEINLKSEIYRAYYSTTQFWSQLLGLLTLFTNTSITSTVPHLMSLAARKLSSSHQAYFARFFPKIKLSLIILSSIFILVQSILMITDYHFEKSFPNRTIIWNFSSEPFSVVICLPIETLIDNDTAMIKGKNSQILGNFPFEQLEMKTRAFKNGVKEIHLLHGKSVKTLNWTVAEKVLFKNSSFNQLNRLSRCFRIELNFEDLKYRKMMPFHYLVIRFRSEFREVYLMERSQNFSSGLVDFKGDYFVRKTTEKALPGSRKANCRKMKKRSSKSEMIDRCINQRFLDQHFALPVNSVFDKDTFGNEINGYKFKETSTAAIEQTCREIYKDRKSSCQEVRFRESMKKMSSYDDNSIRLNLNYEDSISKEIDQSPIKVVLHILNLESIFFKNNVAGCLIFFFAVLKRTVKLNWSTGKLGRFLVLSICFLGFLVHNVFVFKGIINEELAQNGYFKVMRQFSLPNAVFCFDLSKFKLNENHKMTGDYLKSVTGQLRLGNIIEKVTYFNRTNYNQVWPESGSVNHSDSEITISPLYLLDAFYCLEFQLNVKFDEADFYILMNKFIIHIDFKCSFTEVTSKTYLFYRQSGQKEVSDLREYEIGPDSKGNKPIYEIVLELFEVDRNDEFEDLKDPRRLLFGKRKTKDVNDYLSEMQAKFGDFGYESLTTNEIPLEHANFGKEIDNELFKQFFLQVMNVTDHLYPVSLNSKLTFFNFYSKRIDPDKVQTLFQFSILPISKRVEILNNENYAKLIQDILNSLSLWLNISITDLVVYINWIFSFFLKLYYLLVSVRVKLGSSDCFR